MFLLCGGGCVPVDAPVFKTGGRLHSRLRWVRLPSTPAYPPDDVGVI